MRCITLLSDMGLQDASPAIARGILMQHAPGVMIADITHEVQPFNLKQAAYLLGASYKNFPQGSFHIALFDIFSEKTPCLVLCSYEGHYFLVPDTGLLPMALHTEELTGYQCFKMGKEQSFHQWVACCGDVVTRLQGTLADALGLPALQLKAFPAKLPADTGVLQCDVVHIDQYDNVVIDFTRRQYEQYAPGRKFTLHFMRVEEVWTVSNNYNDVREGDKLCRFNSNDHLEICINRGKAASLFGLRLGGKNNNIKIAFQ